MADQGHTTVLCNFTTLLDIAAARPDVSFFDEAVRPFSESTNTLEHYQSSERIP
jgi:hypothetical protein